MICYHRPSVILLIFFILNRPFLFLFGFDPLFSFHRPDFVHFNKTKKQKTKKTKNKKTKTKTKQKKSDRKKLQIFHFLCSRVAEGQG